MFSSAGPKDSLLNIEETGEFVCSLATWDLRYNMNMTAAAVPRGVDEFPIGDLTAAPSRLVKPPRVKESPAAFECKHWKTIELPPPIRAASPPTRWCSARSSASTSTTRFIKDGIVDTGAMRPIARLGYMDYAVVTPETIFSINRPSAEEAMAKLKLKAAE